MASKSKDKLIQEAQSLGLDFDSGTVTVPELQDKIVAAKAAIPTPVQPIQSAPDAPTVGSTMRCWNCKNQGTTSRLNADGVCDTCGFNVNTVYNGDIEAARAAQRAEAAKAQVS